MCVYVCVHVCVCVCVLDEEGSWVFTSRALVATQTAVCPDWLHWLSDRFPHEPLLAAQTAVCPDWLHWVSDRFPHEPLLPKVVHGETGQSISVTSQSGHTAVYAATRALIDVAPVSKNIQQSHCIIKERETDLQTSLLPGNQNVGHVQRLFQFPQFATQRFLVCLLQTLLVQTFVLLVAGPVNMVRWESTHQGVYLC